MKFGVIYYEDTDNLGDDIQTYAALRLLPNYSYIIEREALDSFKTENGEKVATIFNGWYLHKKYNWPPSDYIYPLCISTHFSKNDYLGIGYDFLSGPGLHWLKKHEPIGCRDYATQKVCDFRRIKHYFSGCLTLTLDPPLFQDKYHGDYICAVDLPEEAIEHLEHIAKEKSLNLINTTHKIDVHRKKINFEDRMRKVEDQLSLYKNANLVITTRLHCALPCLGMQIPVILLYDYKTDDRDRFEPFSNYVNSYTLDDFLNDRINLFSPNQSLDDYLSLRQELLFRVDQFIAETKDLELFVEEDKCQIEEFDIFRESLIETGANNAISNILDLRNEREKYIAELNSFHKNAAKINDYIFTIEEKQKDLTDAAFIKEQELINLKDSFENIQNTFQLRLSNKIKKMLNLESEIENLKIAAAEKDTAIENLKIAAAEKDKTINNLNIEKTEKNKVIDNLSAYCYEQDQIFTWINKAESTVLDLKRLLYQINNANYYRLTRIFVTISHYSKYRQFSSLFRYIKNCLARIINKSKTLSVYLRDDALYNTIPLIEDLSKSLNFTKDKIRFINSQDLKESLVQTITENIAIDDERSFLSFAPNKTNRNLRLNKNRKRVAYFTNLLLDWNDHRPRFGGGERYCLMLSRFLRRKGFEVQLFQVAPNEFTGNYFGFPVQAIPFGESYSEFNIGAAEAFYKISLDYDFVIYNLPEYSSTKMRPDAIMICHGIWFDHNNYGGNISFRKNKWFKHLFRSFDNPIGIVSVDTNSINVIRSLWPDLSQKMRYIPNFVDTTVFFPPESGRNNKKLKIIFPRRSQINRGSRLMEKIISLIPHDVDLIWIGEGDDYDTALLKNLVKKDNRFSFEVSSFDEMHNWYKLADIAVIPTIACEGTSLSCIEAMASGCATIATNVGGLTDLIFDGLNGLLVDPTAESIAAAINKVIENSDLLKTLQENAVKYSAGFSIDEWEKKWENFLSDQGWGINDSRKSLCIITKNAYHGGVESLIELEARMLNADIVVAGGLNNADLSCPFSYHYIDSYKDLLSFIKSYDMILYHWPPQWAVKAIRDSSIPSLEFVHRIDTADCDKSVPTIIASHSQYICDFIDETYSKKCELITNVIDTAFYTPNLQRKEKIIGAVTSLYSTKGIDILIRAWARIQNNFPDYRFQVYGTGDEEHFKNLSASLNCNIEFLGQIPNAKLAYDQFRLVISASRIEGLPIALLEALSCNIPVIASNIDGHLIINQTAIDYGLEPPLILFNSEDDLALSNIINKTLDQIENNADYFSYYNGREVALALYSPDNHIKGLLEAFEKAKKIPLDSKKNLVKYNGNRIIRDIYLIDLFENNSTKNKLPILINNHTAVMMKDSFSENNDRIALSFEIECFQYCSVELFLECFSIDGQKIHENSEGIYLDRNANHLQMVVDVLSDYSNFEIKIRLIDGDKILIKNAYVESFNCANE